MKRLTTSSYKVYANITSSIAFWPAIIAAGFFALALAMLYFETTALSTFLEKRLPFMLAKEEENSRLILNIVAAGIISLTVFSFSMVMIVLSQASSNLSPRVIPRLASVKSHQVVLGFYIGTIIYTLILLLNFQNDSEGSESTPAIAVILSLIFGILCLIMFVYFIHSISKNIQVDNVLNFIFTKAYNALELERKESDKYKSSGNIQQQPDAHLVCSTKNGYLKLINPEELLQIATRQNFRVNILTDVGAFVVEGLPLLEICDNVVLDDKLPDELESCFILSLDEVIMEDFEQGVKQISEIAVKALSPGINDPGTAIKSIDFLTLLFLRRLKTNTNNLLYDDRGKVRVVEKISSVDELLLRYVSPIRTYGRGDLQINLRLLKCLQGLVMAGKGSDTFMKAVVQHIRAVVYDANEHITNIIDRISLNDAIKRLNAQLPDELKVNILDIMSEPICNK